MGNCKHVLSELLYASTVEVYNVGQQYFEGRLLGIDSYYRSDDSYRWTEHILDRIYNFITIIYELQWQNCDINLQHLIN